MKKTVFFNFSLIEIVLFIIICQLQYSSSIDKFGLPLELKVEQNQIHPTLKLVKHSNIFGVDRNITSTHDDGGSHYRIPTVFDVLEFQCTSNLPVEWVSSLHWTDRRLNKIEIEKKRTVEEDGQQWFSSTISFNFKSAENLMNLTCRNMCRLVLGSNPTKTGCKNTSFIVYDNRMDEHDDEESFPPYINASILQDRVWGNEKQRPGENKNCSFRLKMDTQKRAYSCLRQRNNTIFETGSRIIPCRNPDECNLVASNEDISCRIKETFDNMTDCSGPMCLSFNIPSVPFRIICGSGLAIVIRTFFQTHKDFVNTNRNLFMYDERKSLLKQIKNDIGGINVSPHQQFERSQTCDQRETIPSDNMTAIQILPTCDGEERNFTCHGLKSFFTDGFLWIIIYSNGTAQQLGHGIEFKDELNHLCISRKTIELHANMSKVMCAAPNWNSLSWTTYNISVQIMKPSCPKFGETTDSFLKKGDVLICNATSWPPANYSWEYFPEYSPNNGQNLDMETRGSDYTIVAQDFYSILHINSTSTRWNSTFNISCNANNLVGYSVKKFIYKRSDDKKKSLESWVIPSGVFLLILFILTLIFVFAFLKIRKQKEKLLCLTEEYLEEFKNGSPGGPEALILPYNMELEIPREDIKLGQKVLGSGAFGSVCRGKIGIMSVAIKMLKKSADVMYLKGEIFIVLEYCEHGDLLSLLRRCRGIFVNYLEPKAIESERRSFVEYQNASVKKLSTKNILCWARDIASGMEWISNKNVVHGDLAARNILITRDLDAKVGDFGLSRQLFDYQIYVRGLEVPLPLRWMAYESLKDLEFSIESDVWSYGIVLWELFSLGETPYPGIDWGFNSWELILNGERMQKPKYATDYMYSLMRDCWDIDPKARPSFKFLKECIQSHLTKISTKNILDVPL